MALFSFLHKPEFAKRDVAEAALRSLDKSKKAPSDNVILRDIDCYIRSYCGTRRFEKKKVNEESYDCPFQELNLIQPMSDAETYRFDIGSKSSLPPEIIGYAICEYFGKENKNAMTIQKVLYREHCARPALSLVANHPFEQWTDMDVERFPGLADGIGDLFQQAWQNYGDSWPDLTAQELQQKKQLRKKIKPHLDQISKNHPQKALVAALRELLTEIEKEH